MERLSRDKHSSLKFKNIVSRLERLEREKRYSLFGLLDGNGEKSFIILAPNRRSTVGVIDARQLDEGRRVARRKLEDSGPEKKPSRIGEQAMDIFVFRQFFSHFAAAPRWLP
jgi:hypothetical protein